MTISAEQQAMNAALDTLRGRPCQRNGDTAIHPGHDLQEKDDLYICSVCGTAWRWDGQRKQFQGQG